MQNPTTPMPSLVTALVAGEIVDGAAHVAAGAVGRQALHQVRRLVHLVVRGQLAVIEIGRERHEPGGAEAIRHLLDSGIEAPPFLDHQHARTRTGRRLDEIAGRDVLRCS